MALLPITLGVKRNANGASMGAQGRGEGADKTKNLKLSAKPMRKGELAKQLQQTLKESDYTCAYCGFRSENFQKAIPKDWAVNDPREGVLVTACVFCEQCFTLEQVGQMASGALIWLPEIDQAALNHLMRAIYVLRAKKDRVPESIRDSAERAYEALLARRGEAKRRLGTDDPSMLASALLEHIGEEAYRKRGAKLEGVRVMPLDRRIVSGNGGDSDQFPKIIDYWASDQGPFAAAPPEKWADLFNLATHAKKA